MMTTVKQPQIKRQTRNLDGVLLLNKDCGLSSNRALQQAKRLFNATKAGHTGSLDPLASGVLPICFGEATKFSRFVLDADKTYQVTAKLGIVTSTADAEGEILATQPVPNFTQDHILQTIASFLGAGQQVPSMYSALKHNGQPLYKLARQGISIERPARDIFIYQFDLLAQTADTLTFVVKCSKGTYIRNLIEDLGFKLGCGAHVAELCRIQAGQFTLADCYSLDQLQKIENLDDLDSLLLPMVKLLDSVPKLALSAADAEHIRHGRAVVNHNVGLGEVCLLDPAQGFLGIGEVREGEIVPKRLIST